MIAAKSLLYRVIEAMMERRAREAQRHIAAYLRAGKLTGTRAH